MLLYAYGSYGSPTWPTFNSNRLTLLDRGVIYAIAHIRGGGELGEPWREGGRMMVKRNTFTDFIAAGESLVKEKYTSSDRLVIPAQITAKRFQQAVQFGPGGQRLSLGVFRRNPLLNIFD